ncbi:MAG: DUF3488 domain-containing protein [Campylobacterales bacterium]|nr:DUF3488 domain-containing protein [Campylobacterales bacterium]
MQFLKHLLSFRAPNTSRLLDIAILLSLLPYVFALDVMMQLYMFVAFIVIWRNKYKKFSSFVLFVVGFLLIGFSFFNNYNFADFSRMQFFVSLISSLLIWAISLQRLSGERNFYLKISPVLLMLLSFFFFDTITMLIYSLFVFFVFILLSIWSRMDDTLGEVLRFNTVLFLLSLPAVVVLFIAFPRISFEKADFGFRGDSYSGSEYDGAMSVNDKAFIPSNKIVMELFFEEQMPSEEQLYFRGSVLYPSSTNRWEIAQDEVPKEFLRNVKSKISYDVLLYPHAQKWLYALDVPIKDEPKKSVLQADYTLTTQKKLYEKRRFSLESALSYRLLSQEFPDALEYNASLMPKSVEALKNLKKSRATPEQKAMLLMKFFKELELAYSTNPQNLNTEYIIDSFLFEAKSGYCTHFANAFAMAARVVGIPSRVVTGFKADFSNRVENYLVIKQKDAHAWVELYFKESGWVRFEPTSTAVKNLDLQSGNRTKQEQTFFERLNLQFMYVKYLINNWILGFDRLKQIAILEGLLNDTLYLLKFVASLLILLFISFASVFFLRNFTRKDKLGRIMTRVQKELIKRGLEKNSYESMDSFLLRSEQKTGVSLVPIARLYNQLKYSQKQAGLQKLQELVSVALKELQTL